MELIFNEGQSNWEITRYAGVLHGYTEWSGDAYNLVADARSWESMMSSFMELMAVPSKLSTIDDPCADISREGVLCTDEGPDAQGSGDGSSAAPTVMTRFMYIPTVFAVIVYFFSM
jgi:hypothetical protein